MMLGIALWVYETLVVRFCACAVSLNSAWVREIERSQNADLSSTKAVSFLIRVHNETLSVAMHVCNPNCSSLAIQSCHPAQTPTGFAEIVSAG
jgi:hypothetical protein